MNYLDLALRFNRTCPKGTLVEITLRNGEILRAKTTCSAYVWGNWALVEIDAPPGCFQVEYVRPVSKSGTLISLPDKPGL